MRLDELVEKLNQNTVQELDISSQAYSEDQWRRVGVALQHHRGIRSLNLSHNPIDDQFCRIIRHLLIHNPCIESLDLSHNRIGILGAREIAEGLKVNDSLKYLNLNRNNIQDEGMQYLALALTQEGNRSLQTLKLSHNAITNHSAIALSQCIRENESLVILEMFDNAFEGFGLKLLEMALASNRSLLAFKVSLCPRIQLSVDCNTLLQVQNDLRRNRQVQRTRTQAMFLQKVLMILQFAHTHRAPEGVFKIPAELLMTIFQFGIRYQLSWDQVVLLFASSVEKGSVAHAFRQRFFYLPQSCESNISAIEFPTFDQAHRLKL